MLIVKIFAKKVLFVDAFYNLTISGQFYKQIMIVNDDGKWCHNLEHHSKSKIDNSKSLIDDYNQG